jgi:PAS domain S-box-containing protein
MQDLEKMSKEQLIELAQKLDEKVKENEYISSQGINYLELLEATSDIIFVLNSEAKVLFVNSAWKTYSPSKKINTSTPLITEIIPSARIEKVLSVVNDIIKNEKIYENELIESKTESGEIVYFVGTFSPLKSGSGKIIGVCGVLKNRTESELIKKKLTENTKSLEKKVKELIIQQEELDSLRSLNNDIIKNSPLGIVIIDPSGILLSQNLAFESMFGENHESLIGTDIMSRTDFKESGLTGLFEKCVADKKPQRDRYVFKLFESDKEYVFDVYLNPIFDDIENVRSVVLKFADRTELNQMEILAKRGDKNSSLRKLSIGIAKNFRHPIDRMYMDISFVIDNVNKNSPVVDYVFSLKNQIHKIRNISEQLLALAEPEENEKEICEINALVTGHPIDILCSRMRENGFTINLKLPQKSPCVKATQYQILQVLFNLLENARDAMPDFGELTVEVDTLDAEEGKFAVITVADTGIGIPNENMKKIFQPFFTTKGANYAGLGLMVTAYVIENLSGHIGVKSSPGNGTVFKLMIPQTN